MANLYQNFIEGTTDTTLTTGTTLSGSFLADLPQIITPDILVLVLDPEGAENGPEVVHVTAHSTSATSATILRAQEGTAQVTHTAPVKVVGSWTKAGIDALVSATTAAQAAAVAAQADADTNTSALSGHVGLGGAVHPEVIAAGAAGFLSGADKTKLNGVEALADVTSTHDAATATRLAAGRTISLTGGVTGTSGSFDGSANASIAATVANDSHTHDLRYFTEDQVNTILAAYALLSGATFTGVIRVPAGAATNVAIGSSAEGSGDSGIWFPGESITEIVSQGAGSKGGVVVRNDGTGNLVHPNVDNRTGLGHASFRWVNVYAVNGTILTSDPRAKDNIRPVGELLNSPKMIEDLEAVAWEWKEGEGTHVGLDAESLGSWMVKNNADFGAYVAPEQDGLKGIRPTELVGVLWDTVQRILGVLSPEQRTALGL